MSVDLEALKYRVTHLNGEPRRGTDQVGLSVEQTRAIISALERAERVEAAARSMERWLGRFFDATHHAAGDHLEWEGATLEDLLEPFQALRAALLRAHETDSSDKHEAESDEFLNRYRSVDPFRPSTASVRLAAAPEGSDGG